MKPNKVENIKRFMSGEYSRDDLKQLFLWFNSPLGHLEIKNILDNNWNSFETDNNIEIDSYKMLSRINDEIKMKKSSLLKSTIKKLLPYAAILILALSLVFFLVMYTGNISKNSGMSNSYTTIMTENGQRSKIILPDNSKVWLNSSTTLKYSNNFSTQNRNVVISGQAYFEVKHKNGIPFTVNCGELKVKVLGTKFDIENYPESNMINVVLESGIVNLTHQNLSSFNYTMQPGELVEYDRSNQKIHISNPDLEKFTVWKDGMLIFKNDPIKLVFDKLEKWYNIEIRVNDPEVYKSIFTGTIRHESYEQIFKLIEYSCPVSCRISNKSITDKIPVIIINKR